MSAICIAELWNTAFSPRSVWDGVVSSRLTSCPLWSPSCTIYYQIRALITQRNFILFYLFYFICHTNYKKYRKRRRKKKKKWRGDLTETIGAYERLGLLELWARAVSHQLKRRRRKVEDGKIYKLFSYLLNNLIFSFFLQKGTKDWIILWLARISITQKQDNCNYQRDKEGVLF